MIYHRWSIRYVTEDFVNYFEILTNRIILLNEDIADGELRKHIAPMRFILGIKSEKAKIR